MKPARTSPWRWALIALLVFIAWLSGVSMGRNGSDAASGSRGTADSAIANPEPARTAVAADGAHEKPAVAGRWVETDPRSAAAYAASKPESRQNGLLVAVTSARATTDAEAALAFVGTFPPGEDRMQMVSGVVKSLAGRDPQRALDLL